MISLGIYNIYKYLDKVGVKGVSESVLISDLINNEYADPKIKSLLNSEIQQNSIRTYLSILIKAGDVEKRIIDNNDFYFLTKKGKISLLDRENDTKREFLNKNRAFQVPNMNLSEVTSEKRIRQKNPFDGIKIFLGSILGFVFVFLFITGIGMELMEAGNHWLLVIMLGVPMLFMFLLRDRKK